VIQYRPSHSCRTQESEYLSVPALQRRRYISILEIKAERISDPAKLKNVRAELHALLEARDASIFDTEGLAPLAAELRTVNEALWDIEDQIRDCERAGDFGQQFIELARSVYQQNDRRAAIKRRINERLGSEIIEEKSYPMADSSPAPP
jgi:Family of unknown function (DUF6165)